MVCERKGAVVEAFGTSDHCFDVGKVASHGFVVGTTQKHCVQGLSHTLHAFDVVSMMISRMLSMIIFLYGI